MAITTDDIKVRASQRLTDNDDGGGYMTSVEIVDGSINNLFPDISRLDRTIGRVSLRKFFLHIDTDDTEQYYGAHLIVSEQTSDPNISVALFAAASDAETRDGAKNRLESFVTLGTRFQGWLWGDQPAGSRQLLIFQPTSAEPPAVGDVLCLFNNKGLATEYSQYVRVTGVTSQTQTYTIGSRTILNVEISDPLDVTFVGMEIHANDALPTSIYTTIVSDAAKYYGAMTLRDDIANNDTTVLVDSIYAQLVPTSQTETPLINQTPGWTGPISPCGNTVTVQISALAGTLLNIGQSVVPGSLQLTIANVVYTDRGDGVLMQGSNQAGTIDYPLGKVTFTQTITGTGSVSYDPGVGMALTPSTMMLPVLSASRGYNYVGILWPPPVPGSVSVDYMAEGKWYRLRDDSIGFLIPDIDGTGTGRIDYSSGQLQLTCAALPDVDTPILMRWGNPSEIIKMAGVIDIEVDPVYHTLSSAPVNPGSLVITWPVGISQTATCTDDGAGGISGDATGWINYGSGQLEFTPTLLPVAESEYTFEYQKYTQQTVNATGSFFTLPSPPKPGTLSIEVPLTIAGWNHTYVLRDDGAGNLLADGFSAVISRCRLSLSDSYAYKTQYGDSSTYLGAGSFYENSSGSENEEGFSLDEKERTVTLKAGGISGTIDYITGQVTIDTSSAISTKVTISTRAQSSSKTSSTIDISGGGIA